MPPKANLSGFTEEQRQLFNRARALGSGVDTTVQTPSGTSVDTSQISAPQTLTSVDLADTTPEVVLPDTPRVDQREALLAAGQAVPSVAGILEAAQAPSQAETLQGDIQSEILETVRTLQGREGAQLEAEQAAGIPEQTRRLQELAGVLTQLQAEAQAIPLQIQEEFTGAGATRGGTEPVQVSRLRQNAIKSLTVGAQAQALAGNISLAQQQVDRAVDLQFAPEEQRLQLLQTAYRMNKDTLERVDKQRARILDVQLRERERVIQERKEDRKAVGSVLTRIAQFGAPQDLLERVGNANTFEEAVSLASPYMQDPAAKQALINAQLDASLRRAQIRKTNYELDLMELYGGMSPSEFADYQKRQREAIENAETEAQKNQLKAASISEKISLIDGIKNSPAIDSVVGTTIFTRSAGGPVGTAVRLGLAPFTLGATLPSVVGGGVDSVTGARQTLIGSVNQLISKEFLDNLIAVKAQGATFGALQFAEQQALTESASKIGTWQIEDDNGNTLGYNIDEESFIKEVENIQNLAKTAYERATGDSFTPEEQAVLNDIEGNVDFDPSIYFRPQQ